MSVINHTPFPAMAFRQYNLAGALNGVVVARGTFRLVINDALRIAEAQEPLPLSDTYDGDPHQTEMVAQSVLTPFKPGTDITLLGNSYATDNIPSRSWLCGLEIGVVQKALRVYGPRWWLPQVRDKRLAGWIMSEPDPVTEVPLEWSKAYGGPLPVAPDAPPDVCPENPLGCGIVDLDHTPIGENTTIIAPQIEDPERRITQWDEAHTPHCFGFVSPWWRQREQFAGTYDENWKNVRHPLLPEDFDYRFYQCAHPDLVATPWLKGDEAFQLVNLIPGVERFRGRLPNIKLRMRLEHHAGDQILDLVLDGVHFDLRPHVALVFLTWRIGFPWADGKGMPELAVVEAAPEVRT